MDIKKSLKSITKFLNIDEIKKNNKKKLIKKVLLKLEKRKEKLLQNIKKTSTKKIKDLNEELAIIESHIKKGNKILDKISKKTKD